MYHSLLSSIIPPLFRSANQIDRSVTHVLSGCRPRRLSPPSRHVAAGVGARLTYSVACGVECGVVGCAAACCTCWC